MEWAAYSTKGQLRGYSTIRKRREPVLLSSSCLVVVLSGRLRCTEGHGDSRESAADVFLM